MKHQPALYKSAFCADYEQTIDWSFLAHSHRSSRSASMRSQKNNITIPSKKDIEAKAALLKQNSVINKGKK